MMDIFPAFPTNIFFRKCSFDLNNIKDQIYKYSSTTTAHNRSGVQSLQLQNFSFPALEEEIQTCLPANDNDVKIDEMWGNINPPGSYNKTHHHNPFSGKALSGAFYVATPLNSGDIVFYDPRGVLSGAPDMKYFYNSSNELRYTPEENLLIIFPAWLEHSVDFNKSSDDRISVSFNITLL